jgi:hypothetical protein
VFNSFFFYFFIIIIIIVIIIINSWGFCHVERRIAMPVAASSLIVEGQCFVSFCDISVLRRHDAVARADFTFFFATKIFRQAPSALI